MPFDLSTAQPVAPTPTAPAGFDLSSAQPVGQVPAPPNGGYSGEPDLPIGTDADASMGRFFQGVRDTLNGPRQALMHVLPDFVGRPINALNRMTGEDIPDNPDMNAAQNFDAYLKNQNSAYRADQGASSGADWQRAAGQVASPVNLTVGGALSKIAPAATTLGRIAQGAAIGGGTAAATAPVVDGNFWEEKSKQAATGAALGSVVAPVAGKVVDAIIARSGTGISSEEAAARAAQAVDSVVSEAGANGVAIPAGQMNAVKDQLTSAIQAGSPEDAVAALRRLDFDKTGIKPLTPWVTRDANDWAATTNAGHGPGGAPIIQATNDANRQLAANLRSFGNPTTLPNVQEASTPVINSLQNLDAQMGKQVSAAYAAARASSGAATEVPMGPIAQTYGEVLENFGDKVPSGVRNNFNKYGLLDGTQTKSFTFNDAENLIKNINDHYTGGMEKATDAALDQLRAAVKSAVSTPDGGPFDAARQMAAQRFEMQRQIPALGDASQGKLDPGTLLNKYVINSPDYREVQKFGDLLKTTDPQAFQTVREQIGAAFNRAAFGQNAAGDKAFLPEQAAGWMQRMGPKLNAFFSPDEIAQMQANVRAGAYMYTPPAASPLNTSRSAGVMMGNLLKSGGQKALEMVPIVGKPLSGAIEAGANISAQHRAVADALRGGAPPSLSEQQKRIAALLYGTSVGGSAAINEKRP